MNPPSSPASDLASLLDRVSRAIPDPTQGLPDAVFRFVLKVTPMISVDLLVRNDRGEHLLAWREDEYMSGWHIPGGIIRFNEPIPARIAAVAKGELAATVKHGEQPHEVKQFFYPPRGHFIALLFLCRLDSPVSDPALWHTEGTPKNGQVRWVSGVPPDLYNIQYVYRDWLSGRE